MHQTARRFFTIVCTPVALLACSGVGDPGSGLSTASMTSSNLFQNIGAALSSVSAAQKAATIQALRAQSFHEYFTDLLNSTDNIAVAVDGMDFANAHSELLASEQQIVQMDQYFSSRGEFWDKIGLNPTAVTAQDFSAGIRAAHDSVAHSDHAKSLDLIDLPSRTQILNGMGTFTHDVSTFNNFCAAAMSLRSQLGALKQGATNAAESISKDVHTLQAEMHFHKTAAAQNIQTVSQLQSQVNVLTARLAECESTISTQQAQITTLTAPSPVAKAPAVQSTSDLLTSYILTPPGTND